jgi:diguanylate cyclase (GGDEF)-like protein
MNKLPLTHHHEGPVEDPSIVQLNTPRYFDGSNERDGVLRAAGAVLRLAEAQRDAEIDPLTQLYNRRVFNEKFEELSSEEEPHFAIAFIDVDDFKRVNTEKGHNGGDKLLAGIAKILSENIKVREDEGELLARLGGDEFAVLIRTDNKGNNRRRQDLTEDEVVDGFSGRVRSGVDELKQDLDLPFLGVSIGAITYEKGKTLEELIGEASEAMKQDKLGKEERTRQFVDRAQ